MLQRVACVHHSAASALGRAPPPPPPRRQHCWRRRAEPTSAPAAAPMAGRPSSDRVPVAVTFLLGGGQAEVTVEAMPGDNLWEVAKAAGADIVLGCCQGSCGICEVDVWKYSSGDASAVASSGVARACIAGIPPGYARLEVRDMADDECWAVDGFDT